MPSVSFIVIYEKVRYFFILFMFLQDYMTNFGPSQTVIK